MRVETVLETGVPTFCEPGDEEIFAFTLHTHFMCTVQLMLRYLNRTRYFKISKNKPLTKLF
jgi:hypothetical protein